MRFRKVQVQKQAVGGNDPQRGHGYVCEGDRACQGELSPTRTLSPSHTHPWPPCGSLPPTICFCTWTSPYPVTLLPIGSGYFRAKPFPIEIPQHSQTPVILHMYLLMKMEQTSAPECCETSAYKIQAPGNYPEESIRHSEHCESLR
jgi:hypothetical protein